VLTIRGTHWGSEGCRGGNGSNSHWQGSGTGLIGPGVVREPGRESLILTAAGQGIVYVAPAGPSTVSGPAVTLDCAILVLECEGGALAANVDIRRGRLGGGHL